MVRIAVLCCPCEPNVFTSIPLIKILKSSLCGPIKVKPRSLSLFKLFLNFNKKFDFISFTSPIVEVYLRLIFSFPDVISLCISLP